MLAQVVFTEFQKKKKVTESTPLKPISVYNKTKMIAERVILSYKNKMQIHCIRPATVSGYSDKMRLDLTVNTLTLQALKNKQITVFGGKQVRPNVNIKDLISVFNFFFWLDQKLNLDVLMLVLRICQ